MSEQGARLRHIAALGNCGYGRPGASCSGYRVGYAAASHFSREYKRLFGEPPMRDVERLREAAKKSAR